MEEADFTGPLDAALVVMKARVNESGSEIAKGAYDAANSLLEWANYLYVSERTGCCDEFLNGFRASIVEAIFCCASGLVRSAMFAMRGQIDICTSWLYFKDHPVEYQKVHRTSDGFVLKSEAFKYFDEYYPSFKKRFNKLESVKTRSEKDPYRLLSAHVHSQSLLTLPAAGDFSSLIASRELCEEAVTVQQNVSEYLGDALMALLAPKWVSLPPSLLEAAKARLGEEGTAEIFG